MDSAATLRSGRRGYIDSASTLHNEGRSYLDSASTLHNEGRSYPDSAGPLHSEGRAYLDSAGSPHGGRAPGLAPMDSAMSEHIGAGWRSPFSEAISQDTLEIDPHGSAEGTRGSSRNPSSGGFDSAASAAGGVRVGLGSDSAAGSVGSRRPDGGLGAGGGRGDYAMSLEELAAEDDEDEVAERCALPPQPQTLNSKTSTQA